MTGCIRIAQITDCHLPADSKQVYRGIDPYKNLQALLKKLKCLKPDLILASGDLSEDGSKASYIALKQLLESVGVPVLALPGNHDDAVLLEQVFPASPVGGVQVTNHGPWQIIRLDSCLPSEPHGQISQQSLAALKAVLARDTNRPRLVALHHQPLMAGSPWIDKYRLFCPEPFLQVIDDHPGVKAVVWGHIHQVFEADRGGTLMLGGPSSAINSLPGKQKFTAGPPGPACRWLELETNGRIRTGIVLVERN